MRSSYRIVLAQPTTLSSPSRFPGQPIDISLSHADICSVNRLLAALLLLVWTASVGRCLAEQYGMLHEMPGLECCDHGHDDEDHDLPAPAEAVPEPHSHSNPCGICHMIEHSGVSLSKPTVLAAAVLLPVAEILIPELDLMPVADSAGLSKALIRPPIRMRWGAYLVNTCLPVRGPNLA